MVVSISKKMAEMSEVNSNYPAVAQYPDNVMIEVTNACNLQCTMCYHKHMKRKIGFMSADLYKRIIDEIKEIGIKNVGLYTVGEAFLHPKIFEFIKYAKAVGIEYVYITTNGIPLNEENIKKIVDSGLDSIKFSIDASSKETYERVRVGASWEKLIKNIKMLREIRDKSNSKLRIFASFVVTEGNYKDLLDYKSMFEGIIDETLFSFVENQGGHVKEYTKKTSKEFIPCKLLWNRFIITYDGKLTICCMDFESRLTYGNLSENTLKECWNNQSIQKLRSLHKEGKQEKIPLCGECDRIKKLNTS
jgi:radical SAM protein with 4Fe4S-binding SPASM domain